MYVCDKCDPEWCGRTEPEDLRVAPDGDQVCKDCWQSDYPDMDDSEKMDWNDLPAIQRYQPVPSH
tara:strand:- start:2646 stop:2840 length:195 start_codon:yes stop_codon:yes gene_type:complete